MASNDVIIRISAQDAASPVFKRITTEARTMGAQVDGVGTKSGGAFDKLSKSGAALGAAFGVLSGALSDMARAAAESEAAAARLDTAFENAGLSTADYKAQIDQLNSTAITLSFDDEDATDALARLVTTTGDVGRAMDDVGIAMDIARARQISLAEATKIVEAVEQGRTAALTRMGIVVDDTMSKEEQLAAVQGKYAGQAEAYANTAAGAIERYKVQWENVQESVGGALGPLTSVIGLLPGLSAGFTAASSAITAMTGASGIAGVTALLTSPVGLVAAAGLAVGAIAYLGSKLQTDYQGAAQDATTATNDLTTSIANLASAGKLTGDTLTIATQLQEIGKQATETELLISAVQVAYSKIGSDGQISVNDPVFANLSASAKQYLDTINGGAADGIISLADLDKAWKEVSGAGDEAAASAAAWSRGQDDANAIMNDFTAGGRDAQQKLIELNTQLLAGQITIDEWVTGVEEARAGINDFNIEAATAESTLGSLSLAAQRTAGVWTGLARAGGETAGTVIDLNDALNTAAVRQNTYNTIAQNGVSGFDDLARAGGETAGVIVDMDAVTKQLHDDQVALELQGKKVTSSWWNMAAAGGETAGTLVEITGATEDTTSAMEQLTKAAEDAAAAVQSPIDAMGTGYRVIVSNTDAIARSADQLNDWALGLINVRGQYGKVDDLLKAGRITQEEYNAAQLAQESIAESSLRTQEAVYTIQTKQAPLLATLAAHQADYMDEIADMPATMQLAALGFMDAAENSRALALAQFAVSDASDAAKESILKGAAEADPVLASMLEQMGLISIGADGTVTVNTDEAQSGLDKINETLLLIPEYLSLLIELIGGSDVQEELDALDRKRAALDGSRATIYLGVQGPGVGFTQLATGGVVQYAANGIISGYSGAMQPTIVGEAGPELLMLPTGSQVMNAPATRSRAGNGLGGDIIVNVQGDVYGIDDLALKVSRELAPAIRDAFGQHYAGQGAWS